MTKHILFTIGLFLFFSASSYAQKVKVDFDKTVDFSKYKTYQFLGWQDDIDQVANEFDQKRLRDAFREEMDIRKLEKVENNPDMVISMYLVIDQKTSITGYTNYYGGAGAGYRRGGWGWGAGHSTTNYSENDYLEGTMVVDVYDTGSKNLIWQATGVGTVTEKPEKREKSIPKTVSKMMKKFPIKPVKK
jgi:hypothetical protein